MESSITDFIGRHATYHYLQTTFSCSASLVSNARVNVFIYNCYGIVLIVMTSNIKDFLTKLFDKTNKQIPINILMKAPKMLMPRCMYNIYRMDII